MPSVTESEAEPVAYVYVLRSSEPGVFKVGKADSPEDRLAGLQTGNPGLCLHLSAETEYAHQAETYLKRILRSKNVAREFYQLSDDELAEAWQRMLGYITEDVPAQKEASQLAAAQSDGTTLPPSEEQKRWYKQLREARVRQDLAGIDRTRLENRLKSSMGTASVLDGIATWKSREVSRFDEAEFAEQYPDVYERYCRTIQVQELDWAKLAEEEPKLYREFTQTSWIRTFRLL
jgi:hypothetical protein